MALYVQTQWFLKYQRGSEQFWCGISIVWFFFFFFNVTTFFSDAQFFPRWGHAWRSISIRKAIDFEIWHSLFSKPAVSLKPLHEMPDINFLVLFQHMSLSCPWLCHSDSLESSPVPLKGTTLLVIHLNSWLLFQCPLVTLISPFKCKLLDFLGVGPGALSISSASESPNSNWDYSLQTKIIRKTNRHLRPCLNFSKSEFFHLPK